ncbi:uncharacterized protein V2V93DRAFT_356256 [Kockiozyma suomiensis]|uniref:uncharacterized protein n=1 Tax=Kockiozyma suomiensis TaxID=1337062 RepID=UPI003342E808
MYDAKNHRDPLLVLFPELIDNILEYVELPFIYELCLLSRAWNQQVTRFLSRAGTRLTYDAVGDKTPNAIKTAIELHGDKLYAIKLKPGPVSPCAHEIAVVVFNAFCGFTLESLNKKNLDLNQKICLPNLKSLESSLIFTQMMFMASGPTPFSQLSELSLPFSMLFYFFRYVNGQVLYMADRNTPMSFPHLKSLKLTTALNSLHDKLFTIMYSRLNMQDIQSDDIFPALESFQINAYHRDADSLRFPRTVSYHLLMDILEFMPKLKLLELFYVRITPVDGSLEKLDFTKSKYLEKLDYTRSELHNKAAVGEACKIVCSTDREYILRDFAPALR